MDGDQGADLTELLAPAVTVPVHHDDYTVFRSPLGDFVERAGAAGLAAHLRCPERGGVVSLEPTLPG
jgi:L-ascorbate metabolism protein UlaG (beta-lactamase superfamily)